MIVKTDAVVLKVQKYLESSAIITLYTRGFGKMSVIAKGARRRQSTLASALGAMNHIGVLVYKKDGRELQTLSQVDLQNPWRLLAAEMDRMAAGMTMVELVNVATHADERHEALYDLLLSSLEYVDIATNPPKNALYYFEMQLLDRLGFKPALSRCVKCSMDPLERMTERSLPMRGSILHDGILCPPCATQGIGGPELSGESLQVLRRLQDLRTPESAERIVLSAVAHAEVTSALRWLLRHHVLGSKVLKTETVFSSLSKQ